MSRNRDPLQLPRPFAYGQGPMNGGGTQFRKTFSDSGEDPPPFMEGLGEVRLTLGVFFDYLWAP